MKTSRKDLLVSIISLVLCFSMLLGTTYAWFTDSATSIDNIVKSGKLDISLYWAEDLSSNNWKDVTVRENQAIFDSDIWEPGYTEVRHIKIVNEGDLAFQYAMKIIPMGEVSALANVIDVYFLDPAAEITDRDQLKNPVGTLAQVIAGKVTAKGKLEHENEVAIVTIALKMRENAGNEYQGLSIGDGFSIQLTATQLAYEGDAFDEKYDDAAELPSINETTSVAVELDENNLVSSQLTLLGAGISATISAGTKADEGTEEMTLVVSDLDESRANVEISDTEIASSLDVHVKGVATDNTEPIAIAINEYLPKGLNIGNYRLYHVEGDQTKAMTLLAEGATPVHNSFSYDPATGDVVLYMATFSEVKLIADTENAWNGTLATAFAGGEGTEEAPYLIANADQLALLGDLISNDNENYGDKHYKLIANINLGGAENANKGIIFYPIGYTKVGGSIATTSLATAPEFIYFEEDPDYAQAHAATASEGDSSVWYTYGGAFCGVFDGNGNTIKNVYQNTWQMRGNYDGHYYKEAMGIFGYVYDGTIKNLTVDNFTSDGEFTPTGVIAAYAANSTFSNIAITNCNPRVYNTGNGGIVGIGGLSSDTSDKQLTFTNITVDNSNMISALWGSWDVACGGIMGMFRGNGLVHFENCNIGAQIDVYNDVCGNYQYYWYRYAGMVIGSIRGKNIVVDGYTVPDVSGITANNCTVHFGNWNDYYYCELVANTLASYTHDHQFSRLTKIASLDEIKDGDTWTKTGNFLLNGECYHIVNKNGTLTRHLHEDSGYETVNGETVLKEDKQVVYLPFNQLFQGDGWGVKTIGFRNDSELDFEGITILDRNEANSITKFNAIVNGGSFETGSIVTIGEIFKAASDVSINANTLMVFVSPIGEGSTVSAIYTPNTSDWTLGTLTFSGLGAAKIVINDYTYCKEETTSLTITTPTDKDKFRPNDNLSYTHSLQGGTIEKTLGDIFSEIPGAKIDYANIKVTYTTSGDVTVAFVQNKENWAASTIKFSGAGSVTFIINDQAHCNDTTATISVNHPGNADKFTATTQLEYTPKHDKETYEFKLGQLFTTDVETFATDVVVTVNGTEYTFTKGEGWANHDVTLTEFGTYTVTITDNNYCNVASNTVIFHEPTTEEKFEHISTTTTYYCGQTVTVGDLFSQKSGTALGNNVIVTVNDETVFNGAGTDWQSHQLTFDKVGKVVLTIKEDSNYCVPTTKTIEVIKIDVFETKFTGDFLYRVGNANAVALGSLFADKTTNNSNVSANVTVEAINGNATGTFTANNSDWTKGTIQFSGTGVVKVTITADVANPVELMLEVVDATNLTSATGTITGGDFVLLCDVNTSTYVNYWNCTLYGNGFTYSLKGAPTAYNSKHGHGVIITKNATLDNLVIIGDVYNSYGAYSNQDYYNTAIDAAEDTTIQNCYIANCSAPVKARSNVTIINSTLYGGAVANLLIMSGTATLENVITANYDDGRNLVGMGIVIHSDATETAKLVLNGTLTQYNFISETKVPSDTYAKNLYNAMFSSNCSQYQFGASPNRYVNTGIISLASTFNGEDITDNAKTGYAGKALTVSSYDGYVYTQPNTNGSVNNSCPEYKPTTQGAVPPGYGFDYTTKNYIAKTEGSNDYCYAENGVVNISMDEGDTFNWDTSILTIGKGITKYSVKMNGTDYTGKSIAFNTPGDYFVTYTYTDDNNNTLDENGNITTYSVTYTKTVKIVVAVVKATTKHAEFTFGSSNTASTTVTVGNNTYVMPNVSATSSTIGSTTVSGQTIYYPIVEIIMSDGKTSHSSGWYAYFPVFSDAVTITDYANNGTGDKMTPYNGSTTTMPSGLSVVGDPAQLFKYQSSSAAGSTPVVKSNKLVYSSAKIEAKRSEYSTVIQYSYTDNAGATYYYYIGYHAPAQSYSSCVTPDTLVTLANGTQKRIDQVTYFDQLLVWNFYTGEYDVASASILMNHGESTVNVTTLNFSDGTSINTINGHGFFDVATNEFVLIDEFNASDYIGHSFVKQDGNGYATVELVSFSVEKQYTEVWSLLTAEHYNCVLEGMWTVTAAEVENSPAWLMPYEIGEDMKYDEAKMQADIAKYGLYTYDDFANLCTYEQFAAFGFENFKVSVAKGYITWAEIEYLLSIHTK